MGALTITPADHGGFVVTTTTFRDAYRTGGALLFAGSLADCLDYLRDHLVTPSDPDVRKAA